MNHVYRLCWNPTLRAWVPASELAKGNHGMAQSPHRKARAPLALSLLSLALGFSGLAVAGTLPTGGQIVAGSGHISQSGNTTTIQQNSQTLSLNWQGFDIGADSTVNFLQPGRDAIAVNRVLGNTASEIFGHLNANGQVWLINPNGVLFGQNAQVNVGGIVASTLDLAGNPGDGSVRFAGNGRGSVVNQGSINVQPGGYAALLGNTVSNQGTIRAQLGTVALAGGTAMTLTFAGNQLMHVVVDANAVKALVENHALVVADGGQVLMTAGARNALIASAVNNTGTVQARTVAEHNGVITLLSGMEAGTTNVAGTLDASAPNGGNGGFIETSGAHFAVASDARITAASMGGKGGTWLVDPFNLTIDGAAATTISSTLNGGTNVTEQTTATGTSGFGTPSSGDGDINVNAAINWNSSATLTLQALNNVNLNAAITNAGGGKTVLEAGNAFVNNAGAGALGGNWAIYSASPTATGAKLGGLTPGFIQYSAAAGAAPASGATGNGLFYASTATLNITGFNSATKSYDGTGNLLVGNLAYTLTGSGDTLKAITGGYSQSDAGTGLTVKAPTASSAYAIVNGATPVFGYTVSGAGSASVTNGSITQANLTIGIVDALVNPGANSLTKVYDGTNSISLNSKNYQITGLAPGESITANQPSQVGYGTLSGGTITPIADVNTIGGTIPAGGGGPVGIAAIFTSTNFSAGTGTKLSNYNLTGLTATGTGAITQAPVYLSGVLAQNKSYDATSVAPLDKSNASIFGIVNNEAVTLDASAGAGTFADANAGNGKAVTLSGFALVATGGAKTSNYNLIVPTNLTANIAKAGISVYGVTVANKEYDGSKATVAGELNLAGATFAGTQGSDSLTLDQTNVVGNFSQSDVGTNLGVTVTGLAVKNADGSINNNYTVSSVQAGTAASPLALVGNITPRVLTITFNGSADKVYDGTSYATLSTGNFNVSNAVTGETVSVNQAPATYIGPDAPNVGTNQVQATLQSSDLSFTTGAKAGNYTFNTTVSGTGNITQAPLVLTIDGNPTKTYDGNSTATLNTGNFRLSGAIPGETVSLVGPFTANYTNSNAGDWGVNATLSASNYGFTASAGNPTGSLNNYLLPTFATGFGTILPAPIGGQITANIIGGNNNATKVYDGLTTITLDNSNFSFTGFSSGDGATVNTTITGNFPTADVGNWPLTASLAKSVLTITCGGGGGTACYSNYTYDGTHTLDDSGWSLTAYGDGHITPKDLFIDLSGVTKVYNGNTTVLPLSNGNFGVYGYVGNNTSGTKDGGWVSGEGAVITPTASFVYGSANVARDGGGAVLSNINVTGTLTWGNYAPTGSTKLTNYNLVYDIDQNVGRITPAPLYVAGVFAQNKIYDGNADAFVNIANGQLDGLADVDKNSGAITLNIGNGAAGTVDNVLGIANGTLSPNVGGGFTASGSTVSGTFASGPNVAANQANHTVKVDTLSLGGTSAGNYTLQPLTLAANITVRPLTVTGITANDKIYDGGTSATFTFTSPTFNGESGTGSNVTGLLVADSSYVGLDQTNGTGTFATPNANATPGGSLLNPGGSRIAVTASGFALSGSAAGNYSLSQPGGLSANILQKPITLALVGPIAKVYDGTPSVTIPLGNVQSDGISTGYQTSGWVGSEGATITQTHSANYAGADATVDGSNNPLGGGNGKVDVTASLVSSDWKPNAGTSLSNYALPGSVTANVGEITPLVLNLSATRVYDATDKIYAALSGNVTNDDNANVFGTLAGLNDDRFTVTGQGTTSSKDVGTYTDGSGFGLGTLALQSVAGSNINNYTLIGGIDSYAITKAPLIVNDATAQSKVYDATTAAVVNGATFATAGTKGGVLGSDDVAISSGTIAGTFNNKNVGTGKTVTINAADVTGNDAGNYQLTQPAGLTADITQRLVTISGSRQYNGLGTVVGNSGAITWAAPGAVSGNADSGVVGGDTVKVNGGTGSVASANVGTYHSDGTGAGTFTATGLTLGNSNYTISTTGNQFTINPYQLNLTGSSLYDGTGTRGATGGSFIGVDTTTGNIAGVNGETIVLGGSYTLANSGNVTPNGNGKGTANKQTTTTPTTGGTGLGGLMLASGTGSASNYVLNSVTYTVNPIVLSFTGHKIYDGSKSFNASTLGALTGDIVTGDDIGVTGTGSLSSANVGSYGTGTSGIKGTPTDTSEIGVGDLTLTATSGNADNYTLIGGTDTYSISQATVVLNLTGERQYDGTGIAHAIDFNGGVLETGVNGETLTLDGSYDYATAGHGSKDVGVYTWTYGGGLTIGNGTGLASNYTLVDGTDMLTITKAPLTVTANNDSKTYNGLTYTGGNGVSYSAFVTGEDSSVLGGTLAYGGSSQSAINAGSYGITASGLTSGNYDISYVDGTLTVNKAPLTVTANNDSKTYDGLGYTGGHGVSYGGFVNGEDDSVLGGSLAYGGNSQGAIDAGGYVITASGQTSGNYTINYVDGALTVGKAALTITANNAGKTYDGLAYTGGNGAIYSGFVNGETSSVLGGSLAYGGNSQGAIDAGGYVITASGQTSGNYTINYVDGALTVGKAALTITANNAGKTYDGLAYTGGNGAIYSGFVNGETSSVLGGSLAYSGNSQGAIDAGGYVITAGGLTSGNYTINYVDGALTVGKAALTITANNAGKTYDGLAYTGGNGVIYSGFVNGETASVLGGNLAYGGNSQGAVNAGSYDITASGLTSGNYTINYVDGALDVGKAALTVDLKDANKTYGQTVTFDGTEFDPAVGLVNGESLDHLDIASSGAGATANVAGSPYAITGSNATGGNGFDASNYDITINDGALTIDKAALIVTANDASKTYDGLAYTGGNGVGYSGFVNGEDDSVLGGSLAYGGSSQGAVNAGRYDIVASGLTSGNYTISYVDGALDVGKAALTINLKDASKTYGTALTFDGTEFNPATGLVNGETVSHLDIASSGAGATANVAGSPYAITGSNVTGANGFDTNNYDITISNGALTVGKAALTVTANDDSKTYNGLVYTGGHGVSYSGFVNGEGESVLGGSVNYGGSSQGAVNAGSYDIAASGLTSGNYAITYVDGALDVGKAALTVTANGDSKTYDGTAYTGGNGVNYSGFVNGETEIVLGGSVNYGGSSQGAVNAGSYDIAASGLTSGNYAIGYVDGVLDVGKKVLDLTGTRIYDATTHAYGSDFGTVAGLGGDRFTLTGTGSVTSKNVGSYAGTGGTSFDLGDLTLVASSGLTSNYTLVGGTDSYQITPKHISVTVAAKDKVYDTTDAATVTGYGSTGAGGTGTGVIAGDTVDFANTGATFSDPNAANGKTVTVTGIGASGTDAGNYVLDNATATTTANITPYVLGLTGQRIYDATTGAYGSDFGTVAGLGGDRFTLTGAGSVTSKNVGSYTGTGGTSFDLGDLTLVASSGLTSNYTLVGGTDSYQITPKHISATATANDKVYDTTNAATVAGYGSTGVLGSDTVAFTSTGATFSDANAANGKTVTVDGLALQAGGDAGNYVLDNATATTTANITPYVLGLTGQRIYDATTGAYGSDFGTLAGLGGDRFTLSGAGVLTSKSVGSYAGIGGASFDLGNLALVAGSGLASNYTLAGGADAYRVTPATLTVAGTTVASKTYDGNTLATLDGSTLVGVLGGDHVTLGNSDTGTFASPNAGTGIGVSTNMTIDGSDVGNYVIVQPTTLAGVINPYVLDLSGTRIYDGTRNAYGSDFGTLNGLNGDTFTLSGNGTLAGKNVGTYAGTGGASFDLGNLALVAGSGLAGNYTLAGGNDLLNVTPKTIAVDATALDKMFDDNTLATLAGLGSAGVIAGDNVQFGYGAAAFGSPDIGNRKQVTVTGVELSGADAGNYLLASPVVYTYANITGARANAFGISDGTLAQLGSVLGPDKLATPYGLAPQDAIGPFEGNQKRLHHPVERNLSRNDFASGLALRLIDGGVRMPTMQLP